VKLSLVVLLGDAYEAVQVKLLLRETSKCLAQPAFL
jgi:hypothetical protein